MGGAKVWRIAETEYLSGTPKKAPDNWASEWFYIDDAPIPDPVRTGFQGSTFPDEQDKVTGQLRADDSRGYGNMHNAGSAPASISGQSHVELQRGR